MQILKLSQDEALFIAEIELAGGCSLDRSPGSNWVQTGGGLPEYICKVARAIKRSGKSTSTAIAFAVSQVKKWASDPRKSADTRAKAAAAVAQWESLKAKSKVKATAANTGLLLGLTASWNMSDVSTAWHTAQKDARTKYMMNHPGSTEEDADRDLAHLYVVETWNDCIIVEASDGTRHRVSYEVSDSGEITFGESVQVRQEYVLDDDIEIEFDDGKLSDTDIERLMSLTAISDVLTREDLSCREAVNRVIALSHG